MITSNLNFWTSDLTVLLLIDSLYFIILKVLAKKSVVTLEIISEIIITDTFLL